MKVSFVIKISGFTQACVLNKNENKFGSDYRWWSDSLTKQTSSSYQKYVYDINTEFWKIQMKDIQNSS